MRTTFLFALLFACGQPANDDASTNGDTSDAIAMARTLSGEITWEVAFDQESGLEDCSYTRVYDGYEDLSIPWLCPDCLDVFQVPFEMSDADLACYDNIARAPQPIEWMGFSQDTFHRGSGLHFRFTEQGEAVQTGDDFATYSVVGPLDVNNGTGQYNLIVSGNLTIGEPTNDQDPYWGFVPPDSYACGWNQGEAPPYTGDYKIQIGSVVPDGWFKDKCGDTVRLHDLIYGKYTLVDISAVDCPPCRNMASEETAWIRDMTADGYDVEVVTLLAPSLAASLDKTTKGVLKTWVNDFGLESPVLADRGWGASVVAQFEPSFAYPSVVLVGPDLKVMEVNVGWYGWDSYTEAIQADAGR